MSDSSLLPPANDVCEGYVFTGVCLSTGVCPIACWDTPPGPEGDTPRQTPIACWDTVNKRAVRTRWERILIICRILKIAWDSFQSHQIHAPDNRKTILCRYLENVYPEQTLPDKQGRGGFPKGGMPSNVKRNSKILNSGLVIIC